MNTAERIYSASTHEEVSSAPLAEKLARQIEDDIVLSNIGAGGGIGSLRELSERYSAGRAAAREAVALLERRGLGRLRPGPSGGFIVAQPECKSIGADLANHFRMIGFSLAQLMDAREAIDLMAIRLVTERADAVSRAKIARLTRSGCGLEWHLHMRNEIAKLTGEPVVELFVHCLNDLTRDFGVPTGLCDRRLNAFDCHALHRAMESGDADAAMAEGARLLKRLQDCLHEDGVAQQAPAIETSRLADDRTLGALVARKLVAEIIQNGSAGDRLGSEWDLCERFSVSRVTLRQAIRQLQDSGLVESRRGRGNGLVVRDMRVTGAVRLVLAFLIGRQMDPLAAGKILFQLNMFVPVLAVSRANDKQRDNLLKQLHRACRQDPIDRFDLLRLVQTVSEMADSPIIDLFSRCMAAYEARFHPSLVERLPAALQADYFAFLRKMLDQRIDRDSTLLAGAKTECASLMLNMSIHRPL